MCSLASSRLSQEQLTGWPSTIAAGNSARKTRLRNAKIHHVEEKNMTRFSTLAVTLLLASAALAKDKPRVTVHVVDAETSQRESSYTVAGSPAVSKTTCNSSENQSIYAKEKGKTVRGNVSTDASSTCTTVAQPATAPSTRVVTVRQENVQAVMEDGRNVTLWCQQGLRQCVSLQ